MVHLPNKVVTVHRCTGRSRCISQKFQDILHFLCINDWQSKPHQQHQNPAECQYQTVKQIHMHTDTWFLGMKYACFILHPKQLTGSKYYMVPHLISAPFFDSCSTSQFTMLQLKHCSHLNHKRSEEDLLVLQNPLEMQ